MDDYLKRYLYPVEWTGKKIKEVRCNLNLSLRDLADILDVSATTVKNIESGIVTNPMTIFACGTVIERYFALKNGYMASYRKIGTNNYTDTF